MVAIRSTIWSTGEWFIPISLSYGKPLHFSICHQAFNIQTHTNKLAIKILQMSTSYLAAKVSAAAAALAIPYCHVFEG